MFLLDGVPAVRPINDEIGFCTSYRGEDIPEEYREFVKKHEGAVARLPKG
ncbi:hypothetical protein DVS28_a0266 [Euzebya pacifica]|uniref:Uncharacterized protein n=1 Tax=Euzebya pacifica TaxID=1608957 RepID=A0A346XRX6_9ACTN|nr:hypothetical protein [Euzebya pacifica]AXV04973.1 hypothetical protein DVS28_a0266 [Euzebya pacifica]